MAGSVGVGSLASRVTLRGRVVSIYVDDPAHRLDVTMRQRDAWLTTVVGRVCLNMLRSRERRREEPYGVSVPDPVGVPRMTAWPSRHDPHRSHREAVRREFSSVAFVLVDG